MRTALLAAVSAGLAWLLVTAVCDPSVPFLFPPGGWWADPEPLSSGHAPGPHRLRFRFEVEEPGRLAIAAMGSYRAWHGDRLLAEAGFGLRRSRVIDAPAGEIVVDAEHPRLLPVLRLAGPACPEAVEVERAGTRRAAVPASAWFEPRLALAGPSLVAALALLAIGAVLLLVRLVHPRSRVWPIGNTPGDLPATTLASSAPAWLVAALFSIHAVLALFNASRYPLARGLDAAGHIELARLIRDERALPALDRGFQTYQPPLYHALGALTLALTGSERSLGALTALAGIALVALVALALGRHRPRGLALVAFLPVLLITEPQATNETLVAALVTAALIVAARDPEHPGLAGASGLLLGLALLTRYSAVLVLPALAALYLKPPARVRSAVIALLVAVLVALPVYLPRVLVHGDPFIGNWDDSLGHPYRQPPGYRIASYFLRFGASLFAHPFEARRWSLWDSVYVSTFGDGFGRFVAPRSLAQHAALLALAWAALPLLAAVLLGLAAMARRPERLDRLELAALVLTLVSLLALVRFNLELPYWSAAKGVFLLGLALPGALAFERGREAALARLGPSSGFFLDLALCAYAALAVFTFLYRDGS